MHHDPAIRPASLVVVATGALWGFYWLPVRSLAEIALPGAWGTVAITAAAMVLLAPFALHRRRRLACAQPLALAAIALGGAAFALYSIGFVYGRVAVIILLFFLTPVWSTLLGRFVMGWPMPRLRLAAIAVGLVGLAVMLGEGWAIPRPEGLGEWLALASGLLWSFATTGIRARAPIAPVEAAFVFAVGACAGALALAPLLAPWPAAASWPGLGASLGWAALAGGLWWGLSIAGLMWATARLDPARVGILLMTEVLVGTASAAILGGEMLTGRELVGGALVLSAAVLEVWPLKRPLPP